jgi:hypothetical protein
MNLLNSDVDKSMAEFVECRLEWSWISIGASGGGGVEILNLFKRLSVLKRKFLKKNHLEVGISARGGLEPQFRVLFSAVFHVFPRGISIRVETCGSERKQKCGELWSI